MDRHYECSVFKLCIEPHKSHLTLCVIYSRQYNANTNWCRKAISRKMRKMSLETASGRTIVRHLRTRTREEEQGLVAYHRLVMIYARFKNRLCGWDLESAMHEHHAYEIMRKPSTWYWQFGCNYVGIADAHIMPALLIWPAIGCFGSYKPLLQINLNKSHFCCHLLEAYPPDPIH